MSGIYISV